MKALIVIDMQNDFVYGSLGTKEARAIVPKVVTKVRDYEKNEARVIFTKDTHDKDYLSTQEGKYLPVEHCIKNTDGWQIIPELLENNKSIFVFNKITFGSTDLANFIQEMYYDYYETEEQITEVELVGVCTDICVISNALLLKAYCPELKITVDASCCAGVTPEKHNAALEVMKSCQIEIINGEEN